MKKSLYKGLLILFLVSLTGCGGAGMSAPPVSLPTPVTGRIAVSSPDADGNISVVGEDGAVTGGSTVMVINEGQPTSLIYEKFLDIFIGRAYAQSVFPAICSEPGHACALADENGAFELMIEGSEGDTIIIVLIDPVTGEEISDRLSRSVPSNNEPISPEGSDLVPKGLGFSSDYGEVYTLLVPADSGENTIRTLDAVTGDVKAETVTVGGANGKQILVDHFGIAVTDVASSQNSLYTAQFGGIGSGSDFTQMILSGLQVAITQGIGTSVMPTDMIYRTQDITNGFSSNHEFIILTSNTPDLSFYYIDITDPTYNNGYIVDNTDLTGERLGTDAVAYGVLEGGATAYSYTVFLTRYSLQGETRTVLTLHDDDLIASWLGDPFPPTYLPDVGDFAFLPTGANVVDMAVMDRYIVITDKGNNKIYFYELDVSGWPDNVIKPPIEFEATDLISPQGIEIYARDASNGDYFIFVTALNGDDAKQDSVLTLKPTNLDQLAFQSLFTEACLEPNGLAYDSTNGYLYVSCGISKSIARFSLSELTP